MRTLVVSVLLSTISVPALAQSVEQPPAASSSSDADPAATLPAEQAMGKGCSNTITSQLKTKYDFGDTGEIAYDKPVVQTDLYRSCSNGFWVDVWNSSALSLKGTYGDRNYGDEVDLTVGYVRSVGPIDIGLTAGYWAVTPLNKFGDDVIFVSAQAGHTFALGDKASVTVYARPFAWIGVDSFPSEAFLRAGTSASVKLDEKWSVDGDVSYVFAFDRPRDAVRADLNITRDLGNGWSASALGRFATRMPATFGIGIAKHF